MAISNTKRRTQVGGSGLSSFDTTFTIGDVDNVAVYKNDTLLVKDVDYTIRPVKSKARITLTTPLAESETITAIINMPFTQELDLQSDQVFPAVNYANHWDDVLRTSLQLQENIERLSISPVSEENYQIPAPVSENFIRWNAAGDSLENIGAAFQEIVDDTSPVLGGDLDTGGYSLVDDIITLTPDSGDIELEGNTNITGDLSVSGNVEINLTLGADLDVNSNSIISSSNRDINISPDGTGQVILDSLSWPKRTSEFNATLMTDGSGTLELNNERPYSYDAFMEYDPLYSARVFQYFEDFFGGFSSSDRGKLPWYTNLSTGASQSQTVLSSTSPGNLSFAVTTGSSRYASVNATNVTMTGGGRIVCEWRVRIDRLPDDSTDSFRLEVGLGNTRNNADSTKFIGFSLDNTNGSEGNWYLEMNGSSVDSGTSAAANTWVSLRIEIAPDGTLCEYFIDDTSEGFQEISITPNLDIIGPSVGLKRQSINGTNTIDLDVDYMFFKKRFTDARSQDIDPTYLLLENGSDFLLLEDGTSKLILDI